MSEPKTKAGIVREIVETVVLFGACGILAWVTNTVIEQGKSLSAHATMLNVNSERLTTLEMRGSRSLETHLKDDDTRIISINSRLEKLESAVLVLQSTPGELKAISVRLDNLREGQSRIENALETHMKNRP